MFCSVKAGKFESCRIRVYTDYCRGLIMSETTGEVSGTAAHIQQGLLRMRLEEGTYRSILQSAYPPAARRLIPAIVFLRRECHLSHPNRTIESLIRLKPQPWPRPLSRLGPVLALLPKHAPWKFHARAIAARPLAP